MKSENAIEVKELRKSFKIYYDKGSQLKERVLFRKRNRYEKREVLKGISFDVKKGEAIGLIGHNGCGKSTTLKLLTRIIYPDSGSVEMFGRVSSLIELGAGFHPDMSGRENIYTNASIFGLSKKEIDEKIQDIIDFSELEEFIDNPVRTYSSGMYMRLAFSVAINVNADILLIDEILAVGDAGFQSKCFNKLREIKSQGTTIVIVSHAMGQIEQICDRSIWIHEGVIKEEGKPRDVDPKYLDYMAEERMRIADNEERKRLELEHTAAEKEIEIIEESAQEDIAQDESRDVNSDSEESVVETKEPIEEPEKTRYGNGKARIKSVQLLVDSRVKNVVKKGTPATIRITYEGYKDLDDVDFGIGIFRDDGQSCYGTNTLIDRIQIPYEKGKEGIVEFFIKSVNLIAGQYNLDVAIEESQGIPVDYWKKVLRFEVISSVNDVGIAYLEHEWTIDGIKI